MGLTDDAADWLYAIRDAHARLGELRGGLDEEHLLAQALRRTESDRLLQRARRPSEKARAAALAAQPLSAVLAGRQWLTDAVVTGNWAVEMEAARFLGDLYQDNTEPETAAYFLARSGSSKKLVAMAGALGDRLIPVRLNPTGPWWESEAQIALTIEQAELLTDDDAAALLTEFTDLARRGRAGELNEQLWRQPLTDRAVTGACVLAHRGTPDQATAVLDLLAVDVPREPNRFSPSDDAHAAACIEIAVTHPTLAVPALTRLFDLARHGADKAIKLAVTDRVLHMFRDHNDGPLVPLLDAEQQRLLRIAAARLADTDSPVAKTLRYELEPEHPDSQQTARQARDRILSRAAPTPGVTTFGSSMITDSYLVHILDVPDRTACIEKLLRVAEDRREAAMNRHSALIAVTNLVRHADHEVLDTVYPRSQPFVTGEHDGSAHDDEVTGTPHPLSAFQTSFGTATLRGHGLWLAQASVRDDTDRRWVKDQALELLRNDQDKVVEYAARTLGYLPDTIIKDLDPVLLSTHPHVNVRQMSANLSVRQPDRYANTLEALATDKNARVRYILADAAVRQNATGATALAGLIEKLSADKRYHVRRTARSGRYVRPPI